MQRHDEQWLAYFAAQGYRAAEPLSAGMERAVYQLDGDLVAKVWGERPAGQLRRLGSFYAHLDSAGLPFLTPLFHEVREVFGTPSTRSPKHPRAQSCGASRVGIRRCPAPSVAVRETADGALRP